MLYKVGKKIFKYMNDFLRFLQISFIFLSFFTILYWIFKLAGATFVAQFSPFFDSIENFIHIFYKRTVAFDNATVDFSFLLASILMILVSLGINYLMEHLKSIESNYDKAHHYFKTKAEEEFNDNLQNEYLAQEKKNNKMTFFVKFSVIDMTHDSFFTKKVDDDIEAKQKIVVKDFYNCFSEKINCEKTVLGDGIILFFEKFDDVDNIILTMIDCVNEIKLLYKNKKWKINYKIAVEVYSLKKELIHKLKDLNLLLELKLEDKIICLSTFKQRYSLIKNSKYNIESYGIYKINETEEVFYFREKH